MARIETYDEDVNLQPGDKWIGTDETGQVTRNYTLARVSEHILDQSTGNVIINNPDEEDITSIDSKLKFKDRDASGNQKGYKIIRADFDWLNIPASFADSIWEIRLVFTLGNAAITFPDNVCLYFNGGFITNYTSITAVNGKSDVNEATGFDGSGTIDASWSFGERFTTPDKANLPTSDEKDALVGTDGTPSLSNKYVTDSDPRIAVGIPLETKSGTEAALNFSGNPKVATVTFSTDFLDANYTPIATGQGGDNYSITVENVVLGSFDINLNANPAPSNAVLWTAIKHGES